jgi:hypothetical protein
MKKKYLIIIFIIAAIVAACFVGSYVFAFGVFIFKAVLGLLAIIIFLLGVIVGRYFPYKEKKQILKG